MRRGGGGGKLGGGGSGGKGRGGGGGGGRREARSSLIPRPLFSMLQGQVILFQFNFAEMYVPFLF